MKEIKLSPLHQKITIAVWKHVDIWVILLLSSMGKIFWFTGSWIRKKIYCSKSTVNSYVGKRIVVLLEWVVILYSVASLVCWFSVECLKSSHFFCFFFFLNTDWTKYALKFGHNHNRLFFRPLWKILDLGGSSSAILRISLKSAGLKSILKM